MRVCRLERDDAMATWRQVIRGKGNYSLRRGSTAMSHAPGAHRFRGVATKSPENPRKSRFSLAAGEFSHENVRSTTENLPVLAKNLRVLARNVDVPAGNLTIPCTKRGVKLQNAQVPGWSGRVRNRNVRVRGRSPRVPVGRHGQSRSRSRRQTS